MGALPLEGQRPLLWVWTLIRGTLPVSGGGGGCDCPRARVWGRSHHVTFSPAWSTCPGSGVAATPHPSVPRHTGPSDLLAPSARSPTTVLSSSSAPTTDDAWLWISLCIILSPSPERSRCAGVNAACLCPQRLQQGLSCGNHLCDVYWINTWVLKHKSHSSFHPSCPGLLCLGRWYWRCPLASPLLVKITRASPPGSGAGVLSQWNLWPGCLLSEPNWRRFWNFCCKSLTRICSEPAASTSTPDVLFSGRVCSKILGCVGCEGALASGQLCSAKEILGPSFESLPTCPGGYRPWCGFRQDVASKLHQGWRASIMWWDVPPQLQLGDASPGVPSLTSGARLIS